MRLVLALLTVSWLSAATAAAGGKDMGSAVIVRGGGSSDRMTGGGSATTFSLRLPEGAACPGDSADGGYRVQSFIVPVGDDPGSLAYYSVMPVGEGRYALYDVFTNPYIQSQTARAEKPGAPGAIVNIPDFNFAVFPPGTFPPGSYTIGIACSLRNTTVRYWDTDIALSDAPDDAPGHLRWRVLGAQEPDEAGGSSLLPLGAAAAALVAGLPLARRAAGRARREPV